MVYAFLFFSERPSARRRQRSASAAPAGRRRRSELVAFRRGAAPAASNRTLPVGRAGWAPGSVFSRRLASKAKLAAQKQ